MRTGEVAAPTEGAVVYSASSSGPRSRVLCNYAVRLVVVACFIALQMHISSTFNSNRVLRAGMVIERNLEAAVLLEKLQVDRGHEKLMLEKQNNKNTSQQVTTASEDRTSPASSSNATIDWKHRIANKRKWLKSLHSRYPTDLEPHPLRRMPRRRICQQKQEQYRNLIPDTSNLAHTRKHAIVVPFRNRHYHLQHFIDYMAAFFARRFPDDEFSLWIVEQDDDNLFNRAFLMNVGLDHVGKDTECVIVHDVDLVPGYFSPVPYTDCSRPILLSSEHQKFDFKSPYMEFAGSVFGMHHEHWAAINGMTNLFFGWGGEDDELYKRLLFRGLLDCTKNNGIPNRPPQGAGLFQTISEEEEVHVRETKDEAQYNKNKEMLSEWDAKGVGRSEWDGWSFTRYNVTDNQLLDDVPKGFSSIHHIKVSQDPRMLQQ